MKMIFGDPRQYLSADEYWKTVNNLSPFNKITLIPFQVELSCKAMDIIKIKLHNFCRNVPVKVVVAKRTLNHVSVLHITSSIQREHI